MAFTETNDITKPAGTRGLSLGDDDIRELKRLEIERQAVDHDRRDDESGAEKTVSPTGTIGYHKKVTLTERSSDPSNVANTGILYTKDVSAITELFYEDSAGTIKQLTTNGKLNVSSTEAVLLTGNQTVAGVKTFSSFPVTPSSAPTTDYQVSNKKYVDDKTWDHGTKITGLSDNDHTLYARGNAVNIKIDYGVVTNGSGAVSFSFTFSSAPTIVLGLSSQPSGDHYRFWVSNVTTTGFTMNNYAGITANVTWLAIGPAA